MIGSSGIMEVSHGERQTQEANPPCPRGSAVVDWPIAGHNVKGRSMHILWDT